MKDILIDAIDQSVQEIASTMLFLDVISGPGIAKPSGVPYMPAPSEVSSIVGLSGGVGGGVRLASTKVVACQLSNALAGENLGSFSEDTKDAFAEICNILAGGIKGNMEKSVGEIHLSPPSVILGSDFLINYKSDLESVRHFFSLDGDSFYVEVFFQQEKKKDLRIDMALTETTVTILDDLCEKMGMTRSEVIIKFIESGNSFLSQFKT
ncbi:MAG: chemotaxis protein CheX [Magnetococcales bacterium]|nr:chemotaxis protein CheX [Magnetococcales bacterium]